MRAFESKVGKGKTSATVTVSKKAKKLWVDVRPLREKDGDTYSGVLNGKQAEK